MDFEFDPKDVKLRALRDVMKEPLEYQLRRIFRWYSKTFATPLHLVDRLPLEDIMQAYYEEYFEGMEEPELFHEAYELTQTEEEAAQASQETDKKSAGDDAFIKFAQEQAKSASPLPTTKPSAVAAPAPEPDIKVSFIDSNLLEEFGDLDPLAPLPKPLKVK